MRIYFNFLFTSCHSKTTKQLQEIFHFLTIPHSQQGISNIEVADIERNVLFLGEISKLCIPLLPNM